MKEFAEEFESFVLLTLEKYLYHNVQASTYDPSGLNFCKADKDNLAQKTATFFFIEKGQSIIFL